MSRMKFKCRRWHPFSPCPARCWPPPQGCSPALPEALSSLLTPHHSSGTYRAGKQHPLVAHLPVLSLMSQGSNSEEDLNKIRIHLCWRRRVCTEMEFVSWVSCWSASLSSHTGALQNDVLPPSKPIMYTAVWEAGTGGWHGKEEQG